MSLVDLAEQNNLPPFQYIDSATLGWIKNNRPSFQPQTKKLKLDKNLVDSILSQLNLFTPKEEWFLDKEKVNTLHGLRHILRVTIHVFLLANHYNLDNQTLINTLIAANLHDLRRIDDKGDEKHGTRATKWFMENILEIESYYHLKLAEKDKETISLSIKLHELPYVEFTNTQIKRLKLSQNQKTTIDLLKTADALDRYRLPKLKWWLREEFLKLKPSEKHKALAYELVIKSEKFYLSGLSNKGSVVNAVQHFCKK